MANGSIPGQLINFSSMPLMLLSKVFSYLDQTDLHSCCQVSNWWNQVASRPSTWKSVSYTIDNMSNELAKRLAQTVCQFIVQLTVDTSVSALQLRILLKRAQNLQSFTQVQCRFSKRYLTIKGASNAEVLAALAENCPRLQELVLVKSSDINSSSLIAFASGCQQLKQMDVGKSCLSPECCIIVSQKWPGLVSFTTCKQKISRNSQQLTSAGIQALTVCPLRELKIAVKHSEIDSVSKAISKFSLLNKFVCLVFNKAGTFQDNLFLSLASSCQSLRVVCLPNIKIQSMDTLELLVVNCPLVESATFVAGPQISQRSLQLIGANWKRLTELNFTAEFDLVANDCLADLGAGCCQLRQLRLSFMAEFCATDGLRDALKSCSNLTELKFISSNIGDTSPLLGAIISANPTQLTRLYLSVHRNSIDSSGFAGLLAGSTAATPNLTDLTLSRADLTPELVSSLVQAASSGCLKSLCLTNCVRLTDACLASLGRLPCLTEIRLYKLKLISNFSVLCLSQTNAKHQLRVLALHNGYLDDNLTNAVFDHLARFSALKVLHLGFWSCLTDAGVAKLAGSECARSLTSLIVTGSALVTEDAAMPLRQHRQLSFKYKRS